VDKAFATWTRGGVRFLAIPMGEEHPHILDEDGNNFGSWMSIENFKKHPTAYREPLGKMRLSILLERTFVEERKPK